MGRYAALVLLVVLVASTCATSEPVGSGVSATDEAASGLPVDDGVPIDEVHDVEAPPTGMVADQDSVATTTTSITTTTTVPPRRATLTFAGDVLTHGPVLRASQRSDGHYDLNSLFSDVEPIISAADVAVCHMEVPISPDNSRITGYPLFSAPAETAAAMAATGFDGCSTASNHSIDQGFPGVGGTLEALDTWGLSHAGTGRSPEEAAAAAWYDPGGIKLAHLSYTYGTNGLPLPADAPWSVQLMDPARIIEDAQRARSAGAELVVTSIHWGTEYQSEPTAEQRRVAEAVTASGTVDLIVGHHAHVVQPAEKVNGRWVIFGLGNLVSNQSEGCCSAAAQDGVIMTAEVTAPGTPSEGAARVDRIDFTPVRVDRRGGYKVIPVAEALAGTSPRGSMGEDELRASLWRTTRVVARTADPDLVPSTPAA